MEAAAAGKSDRARRIPDDGRRLGHPPRNELRDGAEQALGVGVARIREELVRRCHLDDPAEVHDGDSVGDVPDDRHVVRDQKQRQSELLAQLLEQVQHRRLHRHVEGRDGLVGDEHFGLECKRACDAHTLALAAGELPRVGVERPRAEADEVEQLAAARVDLCLRDHLVRAKQLGKRLLDGHARVERE